ncbi:MAG: hypothetical protein JXA69_06200, partial [Phycisphaerae bacterium]|nr:hypothetical protein [Phycisphaerae bacterium]
GDAIGPGHESEPTTLPPTCQYWTHPLFLFRGKLEYHHGLGWEISKQEIADLSARLSRSVERRCNDYAPDGPYFASQGVPGPHRLLENTIESAWWSKHLSRTMAWLCGIGVVVAVILSLGALITAIAAHTDPATRTATSRIVTSVLMLVVSMGLVKLMFGYASFAKAAEKAEELAGARIAPDVTEREAIKVLHAYQIARTGSPPIPTYVWKCRRGKLNREWNNYRNGLIDDGKVQP